MPIDQPTTKSKIRKERPDSKSNREMLSETALRKFAASGFDGVSIAQLADELGLAKSTVLHHFKSKAALYGAVLHVVADDMHKHVEDCFNEKLAI